MSRDIPMPKIDAAGGEMTVAAWLKKPGDSITSGEPIVEILTDKVNVEVPSPVSGVIDVILAKEGETVVEGQLLARVLPD